MIDHGEPVYTYHPQATAVIYRLMDEFGGLSNFARGFPLTVNGLMAHTNESLYQACRFPHRPDLQRLLLAESNPVKVKRESRDFLDDTRPDWGEVRRAVMRWCLEVKLAEHRTAIAAILQTTGDRPIAEQAYSDAYWGATLQPDGTLQGANILGILWMDLRAELQAGLWERGRIVAPPEIPNFLLDRRPIASISVR